MVLDGVSHKVLDFQLGGPVGPLPSRIVSISPHMVRLRDEGDLVAGETVEVRLNLGSRTLFSLFGTVASTGEEAVILVMASTPGLDPWLRRAAKMGYVSLQEERAPMTQVRGGLMWPRPTDPGMKN